MKNQALFSLKDKSKNSKCRLLQFLFGALTVNQVSKIKLVAVINAFQLKFSTFRQLTGSKTNQNSAVIQQLYIEPKYDPLSKKKKKKKKEAKLTIFKIDIKGIYINIILFVQTENLSTLIMTRHIPKNIQKRFHKKVKPLI